MTTLITGAGLVGTAFAQHAVGRGEKLVFFDVAPHTEYLVGRLGDHSTELVRADVRDLPALVAAISDHEVDTVVHSAGLIADRVSRPLYTGLQVNVVGTINVLEAVRLTGVRRLVNVSSNAVYDRRRASEGPITESAPRGPGRAYGNSKVMKELVAESYQIDFGLEIVTLRPAMAYGYGHFAGGSGGAKVQVLLEAGLTRSVARIDEAHTMDFEYVYGHDLGRAIDLATTVAMPENTTFNIGTGTITSFDGLVDTARSIFPDLEVEVVPGRPPAISAAETLDCGRARDELGWVPDFDLEAGFRHYVEELRAARDR